MKALYSFPLRSREGELQVSASANPGREDIETLIKVLKVGVEEWPTVAQMTTYYVCRCGWEGPGKERIVREDAGRTGCPRCGAEVTARPVLSPPPKPSDQLEDSTEEGP